MDFERCLPLESKLDNHFEENMDLFHDGIVTRRADHAGNDILDSAVEFDTFETIVYFDTLAHEMLGTFIDERNRTEHSDETMDEIYRAMVFAYQACLEVHESNTGLDANRYLTQLVNNSDEPQWQFERDVHDYLGDNPHVDAYINLFADDIDEWRNQLPAIELAAGMVFMLIERRLGEMFVNSQAHSLTPEDFNR